jgi:CubicO group peptidase (beta-lactamase class C family)
MTVIVAGITALPALRAQAPTRLSGDVTIPARPTGLEMSAVSLSETWHLPAVELCVVHGSEIVDTVAAGVRKAGQDDPVQVTDLFHLGSMTKAMTAAMLATLVQEGRLRWDMTMTQAFPSFAGAMDPHYRDVTLEQLLTHTSGLPRYTTDPEWNSIPSLGLTGTPAQQRQQFARLLLTQPPIGPAGVYRYSNAGYAIAAAIAERVTCASWEQLMQERVFGPLGITAHYGWPLLAGADEPWGHYLRDGTAVPHDPADGYRMPAVLAPAGDVSLSILDYSRFARLHLSGLEGKDGTILTSSVIGRLHQPVLKYSCGWHEEVVDGVATSWHSGTCDTFYTFVFLQPSRDIGIILFTNAAGDPAAVTAIFHELSRMAALYAGH